MAPRGGARPNAGRKAPAGVRISKTIRFSEEEWEKVELYAQHLNTTPSDYIRRMALQIKEENGMSKQQFKGIVKDQLDRENVKQTKWYDTYKDAHDAAEKLCKRTFGDRGTIDVETKEE